MTVTVVLVIAILALAVGFVVVRAIPALRSYFDFRGKRLVTCPETHKPEAVDVAAGEAALGAFLDEPTLRLKHCSGWPERQDCGQECLQQIDANPENCLVWNIVSNWYKGKECVYCHKTFGRLRHLDHTPALIGPDQKTVEWKELKPQQLTELFSTHRPVCWNCHCTETFLRVHPELVVQRDRRLYHVTR